MASVDRLSREQITHAFEALARELGDTQGPIELILVGGAALVLLYGARESTKDVDAVVRSLEDQQAVVHAARVVATQLGLPEDWLNDGAKGYLHGLAVGQTVFESAKLIVRAAAPAQLLAMKLSAWRDDVDVADAALLLAKLQGARDQIWAQVEPHLVPGRELKARYAFDDLWDASHGLS